MEMGDANVYKQGMVIITRTHVIRQVKLNFFLKKKVRKARHAGLVPRRLATALGVRQARHVGLVPRRLPPPTQIQISSACAQNMDFVKPPKTRGNAVRVLIFVF
jgi:hypothetical protein